MFTIRRTCRLIFLSTKKYVVSTYRFKICLQITVFN